MTKTRYAAPDCSARLANVIDVPGTLVPGAKVAPALTWVAPTVPGPDRAAPLLTVTADDASKPLTSRVPALTVVVPVYALPSPDSDITPVPVFTKPPLPIREPAKSDDELSPPTVSVKTPVSSRLPVTPATDPNVAPPPVESTCAPAAASVTRPVTMPAEAVIEAMPLDNVTFPLIVPLSRMPPPAVSIDALIVPVGSMTMLPPAALVMVFVEFSVPATPRLPLFTMLVALSVRPALTSTAATPEALLVSVVMPVKSPPDTVRFDVAPLLTAPLVVRLPVTVKAPKPWLVIPLLIAPAAFNVPEFVSPPLTVPVVVNVAPAAFVVPPVVVTVPALVKVPALLAMVVAPSVRAKFTCTAVAEAELFVNVVTPVKLPPETTSWAVPLLVNVLLAVNAPVTVKPLVAALTIAPLTVP